MEPTNIAKIANQDGIETIQNFFDKKVADEIKTKYSEASIILAT